MQEEIWKDIPGYEGTYKVSNLGNVISLNYDKARKLAISSNKKGYLRVHFCKNNIESHPFVHRLVAITFIPNPNNYPQVNHKDGNKLNNCVDNLEWCTNEYNFQHALRTGLLDKRLKRKGFHLKTARHVNQYDLNGNFIKRWDYILDASKELNISHSTIYRCCNKQVKHPKVYMWEYAD